MAKGTGVMQHYDCRSKEDMRALAYRLAFTSVDPVLLAASINGYGMMRAQWWVRTVVAIGAWRRKVPKAIVWATVMSKYPELAQQTILETAKWIKDGKDADGEGIGGFNQREVDRLVRLLEQ